MRPSLDAMQPSDAKTSAARAFVRSLNILLKFARLYGFDHARTAEQFETAWNELQAAIPATKQSGLLLGASDSQLLLNGEAVDAAPAERTFIQFLAATGVASIDFAPDLTKEDLERLVRAFPTSNAKPAVLAEQLKAALAGNTGVRVHEVLSAAEAAPKRETSEETPQAANGVSPEGKSVNEWVDDPQKLLQLIEEAENSLNPASNTATVSPGGVMAADSDRNAASNRVAGNGAEPDGPLIDEEIVNVLKLLTDLGGMPEGGKEAPLALLHEGLTKLSPRSRALLREALVETSAQTTVTRTKEPMLLRLAKSLAIRLAVERFESFEVRVDEVPQLFQRMAEEIERLEKILGAREQGTGLSGNNADSNADLLERRFWAAVSEPSKRTVLLSPEAWIVPPDVIRQYVEELRHRGEEPLAANILRNYTECLQNESAEARRRTATGLGELADLYSTDGERLLSPAIQWAGAQLSLERDENLQKLISGAFVRLTEEAGAKHTFSAMLQALDSIDAVEAQRLALAQKLRPRINLEKQIPELLEEALHRNALPEGLSAVLERAPRATAESIVRRFNRSANCDEMQRLVELTKSAGGDVTATLRDMLRGGSAPEAAEVVGLLSRLDVASVESLLPERFRTWPRYAQDRMVRVVAMGGAAGRGEVLVHLLDLLDPLLLPLAVDEIGLSEEASCVDALLRLAEGDMSRAGDNFIRLKAVEALGRLRAPQAAVLLRNIVESRHMFHWTHHPELRLAAVQALTKIEPDWAKEFLPKSGFSAADLALSPADSHPDIKRFRRRRYPRVRLSQPVPAIATRGQEASRLEVRVLSLSGGSAVGEKHLQPGALVTIKMGSSLRPIRVQVLMRDARAQGLGFEFVEMDLDEHARLRKLLLENLSGSVLDEEEALANTRS
jgi:PilZ domain